MRFVLLVVAAVPIVLVGGLFMANAIFVALDGVASEDVAGVSAFTSWLVLAALVGGLIAHIGEKL